MFAAAGSFSVIAGAVVACLSERFPAHCEALQTGAGVLLVAGFALAGCALPAIM